MRTIMLAEFAAAKFLQSPSTGLTPMQWRRVRWTAWRGGRSPLRRAREGLAIHGAALLDSRYFPRWSSWL